MSEDVLEKWWDIVKDAERPGDDFVYHHCIADLAAEVRALRAQVAELETWKMKVLERATEANERAMGDREIDLNGLEESDPC